MGQPTVTGGVRTWPQYVLHRQGGIPEQLRKKISRDAKKRKVSLAGTIRQILCSHFDLECPPERAAYDRVRDEGARSFVLRSPPDLFQAIKEEAETSGRTMRAVIIETLEAHYEGGTPR